MELEVKIRGLMMDPATNTPVVVLQETHGTGVLPIWVGVPEAQAIVSDLKEDTFYALIWMERDGQTMSMDSRPSDALALALRLDCPIFVEDQVLKNSNKAGVVTEKTSNEELRKWLEGLNDDDLGRYKM